MMINCLIIIHIIGAIIMKNAVNKLNNKED